jgi:hypothetical protein
MSSAVHPITDICTCYLAGCEPVPRIAGASFSIAVQMDGAVFRPQNAKSFQMTDSVQLKLRQRATIMLKVCELAESHRPETDKAMTPED